MTEFLADNSLSAHDEDGDSPDWVEIFNPLDTEVNLDGYYLTDAAAEPIKWRFPATKLAPKKFLVVFCSGKDHRDPELELHTSFKLSGDANSSILLIAPDGKTVVSSIDSYPEQQADVSYGVATDSTYATPLKAGAPARVFVPTSPNLGLSWTQIDFDDAAWKQGTTAVGFGMKTPELELVGTDVTTEMQNVSPSIYIRVPFDISDPSKVDVLKLRIRYDDGFAAYVNGQLVASANTPQTLAWNSDATRAHIPREYEAFDISTAAPFLKPGRNILAIHGLNDSLNNTDFFVLPELDSTDIGQIQPNVRWFFPVPTPGQPNGPGFADVGPRPIFSIPSGAYVDARQVELSTDLPGSVIRYTTNTAVPNETSTLYTAPIDITGPLRITARVFKDGFAPGIPERNTYVILDANVAAFTSNMPLVICTTFGTPIGSNCGGGPKTPGHVLIITPGEDGAAVLSDEPEFSGGALFRRRGSSTCGVEKFAFNVEIVDAQAEDKVVKIFDFPKESDYILFGGNNFDRINMRNPLAYFMSRECGQYAVRTKYVELFYHPGKGPVTQTSYFGFYAFMEKNKRGPDRVPIVPIAARDKTEPGVSGGYLLRRDRVGPDEIAISGGGYSSLVFVYPQAPNREQQTYVTQFLNQVVASLNPSIGRQEDNDLIDFTAWIDHHILCWYPKNVDAFRLSGYFYKDRNGPLVMGPVWDYDRTMGCSDDDRAADPTGYNNNQSGDGGTRYFEAGGLGSWYSFLFNNQSPTSDTPWNRAYKARWRELRKGPLATENILGQIDAWADELKAGGASDRNAKRWPQYAARFGGFQGEVDHLKDWMASRADWIDSQFIETPRFDPKGGLVQKGSQVQLLINGQATIFYTLDGADPRATGGQPSPTALVYASPLTINENTRVRARARFTDGAWSGLVEAKYVTEIPRLMITEIMYNPPAPTPEENPQGQFTAAKMEFLELTNVGSTPIPLAGIAFTKGVTFVFDGVAVPKLDPGQSIVIPRDTTALAARYGTDGILVGGNFAGTLTDQGEPIALKGAFDEVIFDFKYGGTWYPEANGGGFSIINKDPLGPVDTLGDQTRWALSALPKGSPGRAEGLGGGGRMLPGDSDRDGKLNVTDAIRTLRMLFNGLLEGPCGPDGLDNAGSKQILDWDGNGTVNITDVIYGLSYLFQDGPPHTAGTGCFTVAGCEEACAR